MEQFWVHFWSVWEWGKSALALLGLGGVTVGGAAAVGYGLFKWLGEKWIDQKFKKQMETYKIEQSRELERLRHKINGVFDRTIRLHTKEFEVLPDVWGKLVEAHAWGSNYISALQSYADVGRMDADELDEYLAKTSFTEVQKRDIKDASLSSDRQREFQKVSDLYRYIDATDRMRIFATSLRKDGVFIKPEIKADMDKMLELIRNAATEKKINEENDIKPRLRDDYKRFAEEAPSLLDKIEKAVAARLWDSTTAEL
ncbi:hypothetical protein GOD68_26690 [Sinorhizobium medicae]|nr:hypothetical protein [Sinorhizobium medicae]MDX0672605.1 hypothetical protein [Sinorhizobium medicae]MDX0709858.1 hypothetical protein [Sinorhizobium medicae]